MRTGLTKQEKTTDIWFDEKEPLIHIRTHNTDLKNRLTAYAAAHPGECRQTDADPDTGCMEFEIRKGRFSFRLTAPYSAERRRAASEAAKKCGVHRKITHLYAFEIISQYRAPLSGYSLIFNIAISTSSMIHFVSNKLRMRSSNRSLASSGAKFSR
jgi:hypothetical protein